MLATAAGAATVCASSSSAAAAERTQAPTLRTLRPAADYADAQLHDVARWLVERPDDRRGLARRPGTHGDCS